jgi:RHS repeat-associated protein
MYRFTGKQFDVSTGLYYYGYRYYDSQTGRFTTQDMAPANYLNPQTINRYPYALNNPNRNTDPTGAFPGQGQNMDPYSDVNFGSNQIGRWMGGGAHNPGPGLSIHFFLSAPVTQASVTNTTGTTTIEVTPISNAPVTQATVTNTSITNTSSSPLTTTVTSSFALPTTFHNLPGYLSTTSTSVTHGTSTTIEMVCTQADQPINTGLTEIFTGGLLVLAGPETLGATVPVGLMLIRSGLISVAIGVAQYYSGYDEPVPCGVP